MKPNMGTIDRVIRLILGLLIIGLGWFYQSWWGAIGIVLIVTAIIRICPAYLPFSLNTCGKPK